MPNIADIRRRLGSVADRFTDQQLAEVAHEVFAPTADPTAYKKSIGYDEGQNFTRGVGIGGRGALGSFAGAGAAAADAVGWTSGRDAMLRYAEEQQKKAYQAGRTYDDFDNAGENPFGFLAAGAGQAAAFAAPSLVTGGVGGLAARGLGYAAARGAAAGAFAGNYAQETGSIYNDLAEQGKYEPGRAALFGAPAAALDTLSEALPFMHGPMTGKFLSRAARGIPLQMGSEAGTEIAQTAIERAGAYKSLNDDDAWHEYRNAGALGAIGGGMFGGAAALRRDNSAEIAAAQAQREAALAEQQRQRATAAFQANQPTDLLRIGYDPSVSPALNGRVDLTPYQVTPDGQVIGDSDARAAYGAYVAQQNNMGGLGGLRPEANWGAWTGDQGLAWGAPTMNTPPQTAPAPASFVDLMGTSVSADPAINPYDPFNHTGNPQPTGRAYEQSGFPADILEPSVPNVLSVNQYGQVGGPVAQGMPFSPASNAATLNNGQWDAGAEAGRRAAAAIAAGQPNPNLKSAPEPAAPAPAPASAPATEVTKPGGPIKYTKEQKARAKTLLGFDTANAARTLSHMDQALADGTITQQEHADLANSIATSGGGLKAAAAHKAVLAELQKRKLQNNVDTTPRTSETTSGVAATTNAAPNPAEVAANVSVPNVPQPGAGGSGVAGSPVNAGSVATGGRDTGAAVAVPAPASGVGSDAAAPGAGSNGTTGGTAAAVTPEAPVVGTGDPSVKVTTKKVRKAALGTEDRRADILARIKAAEPKPGQLNSGVDPSLLLLYGELAADHIARLGRNFAAFSKSMVEDLGDAVKPYLRELHTKGTDKLSKEVKPVTLHTDKDGQHSISRSMNGEGQLTKLIVKMKGKAGNAVVNFDKGTGMYMLDPVKSGLSKDQTQIPLGETEAEVLKELPFAYGLAQSGRKVDDNEKHSTLYQPPHKAVVGGAVDFGLLHSALKGAKPEYLKSVYLALGVDPDGTRSVGREMSYAAAAAAGGMGKNSGNNLNALMQRLGIDDEAKSAFMASNGAVESMPGVAKPKSVSEQEAEAYAADTTNEVDDTDYEGKTEARESDDEANIGNEDFSNTGTDGVSIVSTAGGSKTSTDAVSPRRGDSAAALKPFFQAVKDGHDFKAFSTADVMAAWHKIRGFIDTAGLTGNESGKVVANAYENEKVAMALLADLTRRNGVDRAAMVQAQREQTRELQKAGKLFRVKDSQSARESKQDEKARRAAGPDESTYRADDKLFGVGQRADTKPAVGDQTEQQDDESAGVGDDTDADAAGDSEGEVVSAQVSESRKDNLDPSDEEAGKVEAALKGKDPIQAAEWLAANHPDADQRLIASLVARKLREMAALGVEQKLTVAQVGDRVPAALTNARGLNIYTFGKAGSASASMHVWLNGSTVTGKVGVGYETALHELVHSATVAAVRLGNLKKHAGTSIADAVSRLYDVNNAIIREFNRRVSEAKAGKRTLTDFEQAMLQRSNNAFANPDETITWALTNREAQQWLESIPYPQTKNLWGALVQAVRSFLGLPAKANTALSEVLQLGQELIESPANELETMAGTSGTAFSINAPAGQIVSESGSLAPTVKFRGDRGTVGNGDVIASLRNISEDDDIALDAPNRVGAVMLENITRQRDGQKGRASEVLEAVTNWADANGKTLVLNPAGSGDLKTSDLKAWYSRNGFKMAADGSMERAPVRQIISANISTTPTAAEIRENINQYPGAMRDPLRAIASAVKNFAQGVNALMFSEDLYDKAVKLGMKSVDMYRSHLDQKSADIGRIERQVTATMDTYRDLPANLQGTGVGTVNDFIYQSTRSKGWGFQPSWLTEQVAINPEVKKLYDALGAEGQKFVQSTFKLGADTLAEKKALVTKYTSTEYDALIAAETDAAKKAELEKDKASALKQFGSLMSISGKEPYSPMKRFGNHVVIAMSPAYKKAFDDKNFAEMRKLEQNENDYFVNFYETPQHADWVAKQLKASGAYTGDVARRQFDEVRDQLYGGSKTLHALTQIKGKLDNMPEENRAAKQALHKLVTEMYLMQLAEDSSRKSEMRRRNIVGDLDMIRSLEVQGRADAQFIGSVKHAEGLLQSMNDMRRESRKGGDEVATSAVFNELAKRHVQTYDYKPRPIADAVSRGTSLWQLATSPGYYIQNLTQPWTMSAPYMAGAHDITKVWGTLGRTYSDIAAAFASNKLWRNMDFDKLLAGKAISDDERKMLQHLMDTGKLDVGLGVELGSGRAAPEGAVSGSMSNVLRGLREMQMKMEAVNRVTTALTAHRLHTAAGKSATQAEAYAGEVVQRTHGDYSAGNAPRAFNSSLGKVALQFRKFQLIQITMLAKLAQQSFGSAPATEKAIARKALAFTLGQAAVLGGGKALPIPFLAAWLFKAVFGDGADEPPEYVLRKMIGNKEVSDLLINGVAGKIGLGSNVLGGFGNTFAALPFSDINLADRKSVVETAGALALGPSAGLAMKAADGIKAIQHGDYYKGIMSIAPKGAASIMKAGDTAAHGVRQSDGDVTMSPDEVTFFQTLQQAAGFTPAAQEERMYRQKAAYDIEASLKDQARTIKGDYTKAMRAGDSAAAAEARQHWSDLIAKERKIGIKPSNYGDLMKAPAEQLKRERNTVGSNQFRRNDERFKRELADM